MPNLTKTYDKKKKTELKNVAENDPGKIYPLLHDKTNIPELKKAVNLARLNFNKRDNQLKELQKIIS